jgi:hypothetical protein
VSFCVVEGDRPAAVLVEAFERFDQMSEERIAPHLAVGHDVETRVLLQGDGVSDGAVLDELELRRGQLSLFVFLPRLEQGSRTEQASNDVTSWVHRCTRIKVRDRFAILSVDGVHCMQFLADGS